MWNRADRRQRQARVVAGAFALAAGVGWLPLAGGWPVVRQARQELAALATDRLFPEATGLAVEVPAALGVLPGHLVHRATADGSPEIVGRVVAVTTVEGGLARLQLQLAPGSLVGRDQGWVLRGVAATQGLEQSVRMVVSPEVPLDEAKRARDRLWPVVEREIVPGLTDNVLREMRALVTGLEDEESKLLLGAIEELRDKLAPHEEELINRLSERAWQEVGVEGVASGLWRIALTGADNSRKDVRDWFLERLGYEPKNDRERAEFLEEKTRAALKLAMEEELAQFWDDHHEEITREAEGVLETRKAELVKMLSEHWGPRLFERAFAPAWLQGEDAVVEALDGYTRDFATRRLISDTGGPRLTLAHALRSVLAISDAPLLLLEPRPATAAGEIVYEPFLP
ncbi:MAG: hypothetical protein ACKOGA_06220 [Planctomycetaceae bacterium]